MSNSKPFFQLTRCNEIPEYVRAPRTWWVWFVLAALMWIGYAVSPSTVWVTNAIMCVIFGVSQFFTERTQTKMLRSTHEGAYVLGWIERGTHDTIRSWERRAAKSKETRPEVN